MLRLTVLMKAENKLEMVSSAKYFWHLLKLPIQFFHQRDAGEMGSRLALNHKIANLITSQLASNLLDLFVVVFYFLLMLQYDVTLSVITLVFTALNIGSLRIIGTKELRNISAFR